MCPWNLRIHPAPRPTDLRRHTPRRLGRQFSASLPIPLLPLLLVSLLGPVTSASAPTPKSVSAPSPLSQPGPRFYADSWAVVIGIDWYASAGIPRTPGAESDASKVARALTRLGFPRRNIRLLTGLHATRAAILQTFERDLKPRMGERDRLFVYFSGRAATVKIQGEDVGFLLSYDAGVVRWPTDTSPYLRESPGRALSMRHLLSTLKGLVPRHKLVVVDASFSGYGLPMKDLHAVVNAPTLPDIERWLRRSVTHVFTAGRAGTAVHAGRPAAGDEARPPGAFTRHLLDGLGGKADTAGGRPDGVVGFDELAAYIRNRLVHAKQRQHDPGDISEGGSQIQQRNRLSFACFNLFNGRFRRISNCLILII